MVALKQRTLVSHLERAGPRDIQRLFTTLGVCSTKMSFRVTIVAFDLAREFFRNHYI